MKSNKTRVPFFSSDERITRLEILVDELIKEKPQESRVRSYMKAAGLPYVEDPIERMNSVLTALNGAHAAFAPKPDRGI